MILPAPITMGLRLPILSDTTPKRIELKNIEIAYMLKVVSDSMFLTHFLISVFYGAVLWSTFHIYANA